MIPYDPEFRKIAGKCRLVGSLLWDEVFREYNLTADEIEMIKREDLERKHWGNGY